MSQAVQEQKNMSFDTKTRKLIKPPGSSVSEGISITAAGGMNTSQRRQKAKEQPRDGAGRWVTAGANVRWNSNGQKWAGTVEEIRDGKAIVKVRHADGSESMTTLLPSTLNVMKSKARLGSAAAKYHDWGNDSGRWIGEHKPELMESTEKGGAVIDREDGYSIEAMRKKPPSETSPLAYQLYGPGGVSLGIYDEDAVGDFNDIIEDNKDQTGGEGGETPPATGGETPAPGGEAPAPGGEAPAGGGEAPTGPSGPAAGGVVASGEAKSYSVPKAIQEAIQASLSVSLDMTPEDHNHANALCSGDPVAISDVEWVYNFFEAIKDVENFFGGYSGKKWANKIMEKVQADQPSIYEPIDHDFESGAFEYFATSDVSDGLFKDLIAVDFESDSVFSWNGVSFDGPVGTSSTFEAEAIEPVDEFTAREIAYLIHEVKSTGGPSSFSTLSINPEERNLFALAEAELDFSEIDRIASLAYDGYDRSRNATGQARGQAGKFGEAPEPAAAPVTTEKAPEADTAASVDGAVQAAEGAEDPMASAKYFAIVDEIDQSAVLDIVAVTQVNGVPSAFKRSMGTWTPDADMLLSLQSSTPPTIVSLGEVDEVKDVLSQVDQYDSGEEAVTASAIQRGFSLVDGSFRILNTTDLIDAVNQAATLSEVPVEVVSHISKRARALNRADLIPEFWRVSGQLSANTSLIGEFGEVLVASGAPVGASSAQRLESYWLKGAGADKISWGTEGDVVRAQKTFTKYLGLERAYGFATILQSKATQGE